ncbi:MAG: hypothetical protein HYZ42_08255 [Bacteroidetes bacterium]|nr:hypothetical protein [Bacteroidota bacterium]
MKFRFVLSSILILIIFFFSTCKKSVTGEYSGTASVTTGLASTTTENLYSKGVRVAAIGSITASDNSVWTVPAEVNYSNSSFPTASDLYNPDGNKYGSAADALSAFNSANVIEVDPTGEVITGYIFADNYFELYVNGVPIGKDAIPFTDFNSHIVKFKVSKPYTIAMKLVDWEERLGLGCEKNSGKNYHPGDGGMVAVFKDVSGNTVCTTNSDWKAQTFYIAPIKDLACPVESGTTRNTSSCNKDDVRNGSGYAALHWKVPADWMSKTFDDSAWPNATTYDNNTIGVDGKKAYTNFTDIFDNSSNDAQFIWSTNVVLDNEVIVRFTVK